MMKRQDRGWARRYRHADIRRKSDHLAELKQLCREERRRIERRRLVLARQSVVDMDIAHHTRRQMASVEEAERYLEGVGEALETGR